MSTTHPRPATVRKNMDMDVQALRAVKKATGAKTDTEAVHRAFDHVLFSERLATAVRNLGKHGALSSPFVREDELPTEIRSSQ